MTVCRIAVPDTPRRVKRYETEDEFSLWTRTQKSVWDLPRTVRRYELQWKHAGRHE